MFYLAEVFAGNSEVVRQIVVPGRNYQFTRAVVRHASEPVHRMDNEIAVSAVDPLDVLILPNVQFVVLGYLTVVFQRLAAIGLLVRTGKRHIADLEQLRGSKKCHVRGVMKQRVAEAALVNEKGGKPCALGLNRAGQTRRAGSDYQQINDFRSYDFTHSFILLKAGGMPRTA